MRPPFFLFEGTGMGKIEIRPAVMQDLPDILALERETDGLMADIIGAVR